MEYSQETIELATVISETCISCGRCMRDCLFLQKYCEDPQQLFQRFLTEGLEPIIPYSCMLCGRCTVVCPLQLKLDEAFLAMRRDLINEGVPLKRLRSVQVHQKLSTSKLFTAVNRGDDK
ncbi:MAG: 4Fe-4S dicluster domain-containing protein [Enterococcus viikkiensis]|uniref:4Fe-4S dicluster domain-containing protein n=1 Tax=Enterococcus viikkiensis TaxID=930854 RepID=A0ABU3FT17_9ENTE|nr:4Fe-4S dicluster domain-containing protein [Enterococcus viikkiensis]MDT2829110.1 4Fe-4S dicluster domain-containing protein [Enterococcus viikkiensis]